MISTRCKRCHGMVLSSKAHPLQRQEGLPSFRAGRVHDRPEVYRAFGRSRPCESAATEGQNEGLGEPCKSAGGLMFLR